MRVSSSPLARATTAAKVSPRRRPLGESSSRSTRSHQGHFRRRHPCRAAGGCTTSSCTSPGKKDGIIVLATHYETNYYLQGHQFRRRERWRLDDRSADRDRQPPQSGRQAARRLQRVAGVFRRRRGGEELVRLRLSLRQPPSRRQVAKRRYAQEDQGPSARRHDRRQRPRHRCARARRPRGSSMSSKQAAIHEGDQRYFFKSEEPIEDDHKPFVQRGVPAIDIIDIDYGSARRRPSRRLPSHSRRHPGQNQRQKPHHRWRRFP